MLCASAMRHHPALCAAASLYLAVAGAAVYAWLAQRAPALPTYVAVLCALPLLLFALAAATSAKLDRLVARSVACIGFGPLLLLMWAASYEPPSVTSEPSSPPALDVQALFAGALSTQEVPSAATGGMRISSALFADGSELRLLQLPSPQLAAAQRTNLASVFAAVPATIGGRAGLRGQGTELILFWELHGPQLLEVRGRDEAAVAARLAAQRVPLPSAPLPPEPEREARALWPFALPYSIAHFVLFCLFVLWAGAAATRVARVPGAASVPVSQLRVRLASLQRGGAPLRLDPESPDQQLVLYLPSAARRFHRLTLHVDEPARIIRVRETEGAAGAAPRDAAEADMRGLGELGIDPTRPKARSVWAATIQTTIIDRARLDALELRFEGDDVQMTGATVASLDATALIHVICAVVTRSGFDWQPVFLLSQG
jgi:hypothetical protein